MTGDGRNTRGGKKSWKGLIRDISAVSKEDRETVSEGVSRLNEDISDGNETNS